MSTSSTCDEPRPGTEGRGHATKRCTKAEGHTDRYCHHEDAETLTRLGYRATSVTLWPNPHAAPQAEQWPAVPYVEPTS